VIVPADLLAGLQRLLKRLESDIRRRCEATGEIDARLRAEYGKARSASRTAQAYEVWREDYITQVGVAWILGCVFVRFLEDNRLIDTAWLAGPNDRLQLARDRHTLYFQANPTHSDREYLEHVFEEVAKLPSMRELLDGSHNPISKLSPTGDGARELLEFWQKVDPSTGVIIHDFSDPGWSTRFLGDLYQDLSKSARKKYALLQTPEFVEEFILDRTLSPAIDEFGYSKVRMIDPACGSGHFLLGAFRRVYGLWATHEPGVNTRELVQRALDGVYGVDLNPYAIAIARFRLLVAALRQCGCQQLRAAPAFDIHVAAGDSLFHGPRLGGELERMKYLEGMDPLQHVYEIEDESALRRILGRQYHAVVGNPPYIAVGDKSLNSEYRKRFGSCHRQYSLAVPFMERFFNLALDEGGFVGMITANSFMKREFGKKLVEQYIPRWDLTHIIDTSRAHIPKHGTPTVILFGRNRKPVRERIRAVLGIRGEAKTPVVPSEGLVWLAILKQIDDPGSESAFVSASDTARIAFQTHPWSVGGGGAAELKENIESTSTALANEIDTVCLMCKTREDEAYLLPLEALERNRVKREHQIASVQGDQLRDWCIGDERYALFPYDKDLRPVNSVEGEDVHRFLWPYKELLWRRKELGGDHRQLGRTWWEYNRFLKHRFSVPYSIGFAFVATHNHFVLDRGGKIFHGSAPVIKLQKSATEEQHLGLLALLNSSVGCFWMKQTFHNKGGGGIGGGLATEEWEQFYEFDGTKIRKFPLPKDHPTDLGVMLDSAGQEYTNHQPTRFIHQEGSGTDWLGTARRRSSELLMRMISLQEELDWQCYKRYGLLEEDLCVSLDQIPLIKSGERAFEIAIARKVDAGELETTWFERHHSTPITELPEHWSDEYRELVEERIAAIDADRNIGMIEQPEYKRRWNTGNWQEHQRSAVRAWLLQRMEKLYDWTHTELTSCARWADSVRKDRAFQSVAELYRGRPDFDCDALIVELVEAESIPGIAMLRYSESGLRKRAVWEQTWDKQRLADSIEVVVQADTKVPNSTKADMIRERVAQEVGEIAAPPKYEVRDFLRQSFWSLRGKLDVPKERFISFPHCERDADPTRVIAWAGWDHLQQAQAVAAYYERAKNQEGWTPERRVPLLVAILELLPWLKQWHNDIHPEYKERMGDFFQQFVEDEARAIELTMDEIREWTPPVQARTSGRKKRIT
jgi:SAM-dependent methyltransferase